jgi:hypothetical protein
MEGVIVALHGIASNMGKNRMLVRVNSATWISRGGCNASPDLAILSRNILRGVGLTRLHRYA